MIERAVIGTDSGVKSKSWKRVTSATLSLPSPTSSRRSRREDGRPVLFRTRLLRPSMMSWQFGWTFARIRPFHCCGSRSTAGALIPGRFSRASMSFPPGKVLKTSPAITGHWPGFGPTSAPEIRIRSTTRISNRPVSRVIRRGSMRICSPPSRQPTGPTWTSVGSRY